MNQLQLIWEMEYGVVGKDSSENTPLARAIRRLLEEGKPFNRLNMCFFIGDSGLLRWFGIFVHTAGNRIVFFPGFIEDFSHIEGFHGDIKKWEQTFEFDHLSLEKCRSKWHIATTRSIDHLGSPNTLNLGNDRVLWFGMSISNEKVFRIVKKKTIINAYSPATDVKRRTKVFYTARENAHFPIISMNEEGYETTTYSFLHFGVIVGPKGFEEYLNGELGFPYRSPYLERQLPYRLSGLPMRSHKFELSSDTDIQITSCILPGRLKRSVSFTGQSEVICTQL